MRKRSILNGFFWGGGDSFFHSVHFTFISFRFSRLLVRLYKGRQIERHFSRALIVTPCRVVLITDIKTKLLPPAMAEELCYIFYSLRGFVALKWIIWRQSREYSRTYTPFIFPTRQRINTTWYAVSVQSESGNQHLPILLIVERFPI